MLISVIQSLVSRALQLLSGVAQLFPTKERGLPTSSIRNSEEKTGFGARFFQNHGSREWSLLIIYSTSSANCHDNASNTATENPAQGGEWVLRTPGLLKSWPRLRLSEELPVNASCGDFDCTEAFPPGNGMRPHCCSETGVPQQENKCSSSKNSIAQRSLNYIFALYYNPSDTQLINNVWRGKQR